MTDVGDGPAGGTPSTTVSGDSSDAVLLEAVSQGSVPAFRALVERTSVAVGALLAELLPDCAWRDEILAATYLEVWWLAGCRIQPDVDATDWIVAIARRRAVETRTDLEPDGEGPRTGYAQREFATLLRSPAGPPRPVTVRAVSDRAATPDR
ncbi:hypothetical protein [Actinoplanes rectilineatus]|uniref:hypothetical protein n=1 Tax=Actinoplanes rectilineatus TaxID=113571 RepID=UPI000695C57D|nr:hypothetical protein [Actinoplanes rectilineatus]